MACALALLNWHDSARFSALDGSPDPADQGRLVATQRPLTGHEEFPRIDPAVICLVHDGHDRAVLARQTVVAGAAVLAHRRVRRGRRVVRVVCGARGRRGDRPDRDATSNTSGSQPWPFPRSLMVGFHALGDPEQPFAFNDGEIAEADWFTRDEVREALEAR